MNRETGDNALGSCVVIGSLPKSLLCPRCESNFGELWSAPSSWLKSDSWKVFIPKPWPNAQQEFLYYHWMAGMIMSHRSGGNNMAPLCICVLCSLVFCCRLKCVYKVWAWIKAFIPSLPLELSGCQSAFSTWISRSPLQLIYSYTLYWSLSPRWDRGYTAANFPRTLHTVSRDALLLLWCTPSISYSFLTLFYTCFISHNILWQTSMLFRGLDFLVLLCGRYLVPCSFWVSWATSPKDRRF